MNAADRECVIVADEPPAHAACQRITVEGFALALGKLGAAWVLTIAAAPTLSSLPHRPSLPLRGHNLVAVVTKIG